MVIIDILKKSDPKQHLIPVLILIVGTIASILIFGPSKSNGQGNQNVVPEKPAALVKTLTIGGTETSLARLEKTAMLEPSGNSADLVAEYSGRIQKVNFEVGSTVSAGQQLVIFEQSDSVNSPKISLDNAQRSYEIAVDNLDKTKDSAQQSIDLAKKAVNVAELQYKQAADSNTKKLAKENLSIAKKQKDQAEQNAELQINGSKLQLEQAQSTLDQAEISYQKTIIKAPISGVVVSKNIAKDDYINSGQTLAQIVGQGKLESLLYLTSDEIARISLGDQVEITVDEKKIGGVVKSLSPIANADNQRYEARIETSQDASDLANKSAQIVLKFDLAGQSAGTFFIPLDAVNIGQQKKEVFVIVDGKAQAREIKTGRIIGTQIEVIEGLRIGDALIIDNSRNLQNDQPVKIQS